MTTTPTPASQPSPAPGHSKFGSSELQAKILEQALQPSPARSDTLAIAEEHKYVLTGDANLIPVPARSDMPTSTVFYVMSEQTREELRPIATWQDRAKAARDQGAHTDDERPWMRAEIADVRAALARRATAGTTAAAAQLEGALARVAALSKAGMDLTSRIVLHSPIEVNGVDYVRRDSMMDAVVDWRKAFDSAPKIERATAGSAAPTDSEKAE